MAALEHKIDFIALISVNRANPNGDPLNGNRPRTDYNGLGEISDVCIKRKIRNRMQDMGEKIFVQSNDRSDDGCTSLQERVKKTVDLETNKKISDLKDENEYAAAACRTWLDVRSFGQVFSFKEKGESVSIGVRGPVSIHQAVSLSQVEVQSMQITKSVNGASGEKRASDTMGAKHFVRFGVYKLKGSINVQLAKKTGFSSEDAQILKDCLLTLFENDSSSARPEGSMEVIKLYWWEQDCKEVQYSSAQVHRSLKCELRHPEQLPESVEDYEFIVDEEATPGLKPEVKPEV